MKSSHVRILALVFAAAGPEPVFAQMPASSSVVHTVSVTVPSRVRVEVKNLPTTSVASKPAAGPRGLSVSVIATQRWALAIGTSAKRSDRRLQWSRQSARGFSNVAESGTVIARGAIAAAPVDADLFVRNGAEAESDPVFLTVTAQ